MNKIEEFVELSAEINLRKDINSGVITYADSICRLKYYKTAMMDVLNFLKNR
jgi:hypothetical protein